MKGDGHFALFGTLEIGHTVPWSPKRPELAIPRNGVLRLEQGGLCVCPTARRRALCIGPSHCLVRKAEAALDNFNPV